MAEIKRIAAEMGDQDRFVSRYVRRGEQPPGRQVPHVPQGRGDGGRRSHSAGDSTFTLALGRTASLAAAKLLDTKCKVPFEVLDLPIGLRATDAFVDTLEKDGRGECAGEHHGGAGSGGGRDHRHASVFLRKEGRPGGRSRSPRLARPSSSPTWTWRCLVVTGTPAGPKFEKADPGVCGRRRRS